MSPATQSGAFRRLTATALAAVSMVVALMLPLRAQAQGLPFGCATDFYQTRQGTGGTALLKFSSGVLTAGGTATNVYGSLLATGINGASLRPTDGFIYGLDTSAGPARLHRLGSTGSVLVGTVVTAGGVPAPLVLTTATAFTPTAGAFDAAGRFYFAGQGGGNLSPGAIYRVDDFVTDVDAGTAGVQLAAAQVYALSATVTNIGDVAFGPDGNLYGATGTTLVQLALTGSIATVSTRTLPSSVGGIGSAFFNNLGEFFVYDNGAQQLRQVGFSFGALFGTAAVTVGTPVTITGAAPLPTTTSSSDGISCVTFLQSPTLTIRKISTAGVGTFPFTGNNGFANQSITTVTAGTAVTATTQTLQLPGVATAITETPATGFSLTSATCTGTGAGSAVLVGTTLTLNPLATASGNTIVCTFTNTAVAADLSVTKTNAVTTLVSGAVTSYTVRVSNGGPATVTGAVFADPAVAGLSVTAVACSPTPGQCVTAPTLVQLQSGTFALPALSQGQFYEITIAATVTATGL
jgi:hypothetical protein